jgi:asparagine synthase (glutamine-hydrolysing)
MSILLGIFSRNPGSSIQDTICASMTQIISRHPGNRTNTYRNENVFLIKADIGAYAQPAFHIESCGSVSMLAGEPLLTIDEQDRSRTRKEDLEILHRAWDSGDWSILKKAQGSFCAVHCQSTGDQLNLISDKLGLRPLYYWDGGSYVIFSTALRLLETLPEVPKKMDVRAITEFAGLGFHLSRRTPYIDIYRLEASMVVQFSKDRVSQSKYWSWDTIPMSDKSEEERLHDIYDKFSSAVSRRLRDDKSTLCLLSGGLDSRCMAAVLRNQGVVLHTFNFAAPGTQDLVFGEQFAQAVGSIHTNVEISNESTTPFEDIAATIDAWTSSKHRDQYPADRPALAWIGHGGSVALGHVYLNTTIVDLMRAGKPEEAVDFYLKSQHRSILPKLLSGKVFNELSDVLMAGIREELSGISCSDPARDFYLFLMLDEQRCLLSTYYENIDIHRLEFQLPFFDSDFLASIVAEPIDGFLYHRFYHKWLECFQSAVTSVPWQTYPTHEPCPIPIPPGLTYQWDNRSSHSGKNADARKRELLRQARGILKSGSFPCPIMNWLYFRFATWAYRAGLRDYGYVIDRASIYDKYWQISNGRYELSSEANRDGLNS